MNKPKWADLFGMDPEYNKDALEAEGERLIRGVQGRMDGWARPH